MKNLLLLLCTVFSVNCVAETTWIENSVEWLTEALPEETLFNFDSEGLGFQGCKQREYQMRLSQPLSEHFMLDSAIGYAKGKLQWGVFSQKVSMYEWSLVPRYQLSERVSFGVGFVSQSEVSFRTTQGIAFDLPRNTEWLAVSRFQGLAEDHYWELKISSQKWQASADSGTWFERGEADNKINLSYSGYF